MAGATQRGVSGQTDWSRFPVVAMSRATYVKRLIIHASLIAAVKRRAPRGSPVLEVGIGSGAQSAALSHTRRVIAVDNDERIIRAARPNLERFGRGVRVVRGDAFTLPLRDDSCVVAFSQGLMEHFADEHIAEILREQLRTCRSVVFSVPSDRYPRKDVGDERLLPPSEWARIVGSVAGEYGATYSASYYSLDLESLKYSLIARKPLGSFSVLVTIDRVNARAATTTSG